MYSLSFDRWMESRTLSKLCDANILRAIVLAVTGEVTITQIHELLISLKLKSLIIRGVDADEEATQH